MATKKRNIFERASRNKLRFVTERGNLTTEDLWDLELTRGAVNLNDMAKAINRELKGAEEEDFVTKASPRNVTLKLKLEILKFVIETKLEEAKASEERAVSADKKRRIAAVLAEKQDDELKSMSPEELQELHDSL